MQDTNINMFFLNSLLATFIEIAPKSFKKGKIATILKLWLLL